MKPPAVELAETYEVRSEELVSVKSVGAHGRRCWRRGHAGTGRRRRPRYRLPGSRGLHLTDVQGPAAAVGDRRGDVARRVGLDRDIAARDPGLWPRSRPRRPAGPSGTTSGTRIDPTPPPPPSVVAVETPVRPVGTERRQRRAAGGDRQRVGLVRRGRSGRCRCSACPLTE